MLLHNQSISWRRNDITTAGGKASRNPSRCKTFNADAVLDSLTGSACTSPGGCDLVPNLAELRRCTSFDHCDSAVIFHDSIYLPN